MQLAFNEFGTGSAIPVVLLHGFPMDSRIWQPVVDRLTGRVITVDLFGFGRSQDTESFSDTESVSGTGPFSMESAAAQLQSALAERNALPCVLAGLSMGGYLALAFASRFQSDLAGLILVDTKSMADTDLQKQARNEMIQLVRSKGVPAVAEAMLPRMFGASAPDAMKQAFKQIMLSCPATAIEHAILAMRDRPDYSPVLNHLTCPRLILVGDQDQITPPEIATQMQLQSPGAEMIVFAGAGHMAPIEQPMQVAFAIDFFRERRISRKA
jgi:pimeloyl-ACP methyl ester carboxylesterase